MTNVLPPGWYEAKLGELGDWTSGGTPSRSHPEYYGEGVPWVKTGDLPDGPLGEVPESITEIGLQHSAAKRLPKGTLLVAMYGATIGRLGLLQFEAATNQACAALLPTGKTSDLIPYVFQYLLGQREDLRRIGQGGAQPNISQGILKEYGIPLPPLNEQRRIVAKLEALHARSRRAREALDAVPPLLEKLRQSILAAAFRGDLTKEWRAKHKDVEPASKLLERIRAERRKKWEENEIAKMKAKGKSPSDEKWKAKYKEPEPVDATGLPGLPEGWCWASLDELAVIVGGITKGQHRSGTEALQRVPYLRVANVQRGHLSLDEIKTIDATEEEVRELRLFPGDVLLNEGGDRDKLGRGWVWEGQLPECIHQNHVFRARLVVADLQPRYVSHYANQVGQSFFVDQGKQTTNLASVSMSRVRRLPVALPPAEEQAVMVQLLHERLAQASRLEVMLREAIQGVGALSASTLAKAFRGELVPQDPNDEPADAMLARLRSTRGTLENGSKLRSARKAATAPDGHAHPKRPHRMTWVTKER